MEIPVFKSDEEEAEFWDTHSPLDFLEEPDAKLVKVKAPKDRMVVIRLDSGTRQKLEKLAAEHNVGPSTFVRLILMSALKEMADKNENAGGGPNQAPTEVV